MSSPPPNNNSRPRPLKNSDFRSLFDIVTAKHGLSREFQAIEICQRYRQIQSQILPNAPASQIYPISFQRGTLTIAVPSSTWAHQININRHHILSHLNRQTPESSTIKQLRTRLTTGPQHQFPE